MMRMYIDDADSGKRIYMDASESKSRPDDFTPAEFVERFEITPDDLMSELASGRLIAIEKEITPGAVAAILHWAAIVRWMGNMQTPEALRRKAWRIGMNLALDSDDETFQIYFKHEDIMREFPDKEAAS